MPTDPQHDQTPGQDQEDAANNGASSPDPAEGSDDSSAPGPGSPGQ